MYLRFPPSHTVQKAKKINHLQSFPKAIKKYEMLLFVRKRDTFWQKKWAKNLFLEPMRKVVEIKNFREQVFEDCCPLKVFIKTFFGQNLQVFSVQKSQAIELMLKNCHLSKLQPKKL